MTERKGGREGEREGQWVWRKINDVPLQMSEVCRQKLDYNNSGTEANELLFGKRWRYTG